MSGARVAHSVRVGDPRGSVASLFAARARERAGARAGKPIVVNATAAVAALIADAELPIAVLRGIALISRCAGLVGHIREEQQSPAMRALWESAEAAVPYKEQP